MASVSLRCDPGRRCVGPASPAHPSRQRPHRAHPRWAAQHHRGRHALDRLLHGGRRAAKHGGFALRRRSEDLARSQRHRRCSPSRVLGWRLGASGCEFGPLPLRVAALVPRLVERGAGPTTTMTGWSSPHRSTGHDADDRARRHPRLARLDTRIEITRDARRDERPDMKETRGRYRPSLRQQTSASRRRRPRMRWIDTHRPPEGALWLVRALGVSRRRGMRSTSGPTATSTSTRPRSPSVARPTARSSRRSWRRSGPVGEGLGDRAGPTARAGDAARPDFRWRSRREGVDLAFDPERARRGEGARYAGEFAERRCASEARTSPCNRIDCALVRGGRLGRPQ